MKTCSQCIGLTIAVACSLCFPDLVSAQAFPAQALRGIAVGQTFGQGIVGGSGVSDSQDGKDYGGYPGAEVDSIPFAGRYRNSCFGNIWIEENPMGISVSVNGRRVQARNAAELRQMYPDAYRLYERTLGRRKRMLFARFAALKAGLTDTNRAVAAGGMPGPFGAN